MNFRDLSQRRDADVGAMNAILVAPADDGELSAGQEAELEALRGKVEKTERRMTERAFVDAADRRAPGVPLNGAPAFSRAEVRVFAQCASAAPQGFDGSMLHAQDGSVVPVLEARHKLADFAIPEQRGPSLSFGGFLRALVLGPSTDVERRVMAESSIGTGGAMVPVPMATEIIDAMRAESVAFKAGCRTVPMSSQTLKFARVVSDPVGGWRAENAPIVEGEPTFDQATLTARSWALLTRISRELLEDGQNTDALLRGVFARTAALALDRAIMWGSGTANTPLGVANTPGIQTVSMGANGAVLANWGRVLDAVAALEGANAGNVTAMVLAPRTARTIYGLADTTNAPLALPPRLAGIPVLTTTSASVTETQGTSSAASSIILGDFREVYVGIRTALTISILNERYADTGQIGFVSWLRADVLVARPAALARITGITG